MEQTIESTEVMEFFKTFANIERLKIAGLLATEAHTPAEIAELLKIKPMLVLRHLEQLTHSGLVCQTEQVYRFDGDALNELSRRVLQGLRPTAKMEDFEGEDFERKVLKDSFTADGKLRAIPTQQKKRLVVLNYLAKAFENGRRYPEKQVNQMLQVYNPDFAALRRYLVDEGLLKRENGVYWKE